MYLYRGIQCSVLRYSVLLILLQNALISAYTNIAISEMCLTVRCIWCVLYLEYHMHTSTYQQIHVYMLNNVRVWYMYVQKSNIHVHVPPRYYYRFIRLYKYHHSTKLYRKISRVCCRLYFYECAARVTMPTATNEWYFFQYGLVLWW